MCSEYFFLVKNKDNVQKYGKNVHFTQSYNF